jgi:hypothetical protein
VIHTYRKHTLRILLPQDDPIPSVKHIDWQNSLYGSVCPAYRISWQLRKGSTTIGRLRIYIWKQPQHDQGRDVRWPRIRPTIFSSAFVAPRSNTPSSLKYRKTVTVLPYSLDMFTRAEEFSFALHIYYLFLITIGWNAGLRLDDSFRLFGLRILSFVAVFRGDSFNASDQNCLAREMLIFVKKSYSVFLSCIGSPTCKRCGPRSRLQ